MVKPFPLEALFKLRSLSKRECEQELSSALEAHTHRNQELIKLETELEQVEAELGGRVRRRSQKVAAQISSAAELQGASDYKESLRARVHKLRREANQADQELKAAARRLAHARQLLADEIAHLKRVERDRNKWKVRQERARAEKLEED